MNVLYNVLHKCVESKKKKNVNDDNKNEKQKQD